MPFDLYCYRSSVPVARLLLWLRLCQAPDACGNPQRGIMYLMYYTDADGKRVYTLDVSCLSTHCIQRTWRRLTYA